MDSDRRKFLADFPRNDYGDFPANRNAQGGSPLPKRVVLRDFDLFVR
jgi:hypothetical protein